jgi:adenylate cyclase
MKQVARELGVQNVVEGSVRRSSDRVRITAQLVETATGNQVWAERYDREMRDIFALQDEVTRVLRPSKAAWRLREQSDLGASRPAIWRRTTFPTGAREY